MAPNLAHVQGRHAVTPHGGARVGSRGRRFVTAALGRLWASSSPASRPVRGVLPLDWDRRHRVTPGETTSQEAWPEAEPLGPTSLWQEPWWDAERRARSALRAPHLARFRCGRWLRVSRRSASLLSFLPSWLKAQIVRPPASTAGILWRRSVRRARGSWLYLMHVTMTRVQMHRENAEARVKRSENGEP
jgi:hypothetical protein